jgi:hypothetical protein
VHAVAQALLERNDLTGKQCIEVIRAAAIDDQTMGSELLLKALVEDTIVNGNGNKPEEVPVEETKSKSKAKPRPTAKAKAK